MLRRQVSLELLEPAGYDVDPGARGLFCASAREDDEALAIPEPPSSIGGIHGGKRLAGNGAVSAEALMLAADGEEVPSFKAAKRAFETRYVEGLLRRCSGNISRAARLAKKDRKDFYDVIRRTGVNPQDFR